MNGHHIGRLGLRCIEQRSGKHQTDKEAFHFFTPPSATDTLCH